MASLNESCPPASPTALLRTGLAQETVRQRCPWGRFLVLACRSEDQDNPEYSCPVRVEARDLPHPTEQLRGGHLLVDGRFQKERPGLGSWDFSGDELGGNMGRKTLCGVPGSNTQEPGT